MLSRAIVGIVALCFSVATPAVAADSYTSRDIRQPIIVTAKERNQFLFEMRELLHGLFNLHLALSKNDFKAAAVAARPIGHFMEHVPDALRERLPTEYVQLAIAMEESFHALARTAEEKQDMSAIQAQLAESMTYCSGCHDTFRFEVRGVIPGKK
jgi:parvulin-like peptidyl-prolyl isomerase